MKAAAFTPPRARDAAKEFAFAKGFTLIEVALAIGILIFALLPLIAMVTVGFSSTSDSIADTRTSAIAAKVFQQSQAELATSGTTENSDAFDIPLPPWQTSGASSYRDYWFDNQGTVVTSATAGYYRARATFGSPLAANVPVWTSTNTLKALKIDVAYPVISGSLAQMARTRTFSLFISNQTYKGAYP
jgi:uncharacterized protein (TIGR02598 family)